MKNYAIKYLFLALVSLTGFAQNLSYQTPPKEIEDLLLSSTTPTVQVDSKGELMLLISKSPMPSIAELAEPELKLAGLRINPSNFGPSRANYSNTLKLLKIKTKEEISIKNLPTNPLISNIKWSPDETKIAFTNSTDNAIELWFIDLKTNVANKRSDFRLNAIFGSPYVWLSDSKTLIVATVPAEKRILPQINRVPTGPTIQEAIGKKSPARTYPDMLKNTDDEALFEYYAASQLLKISIDKKKSISLGKPALFQAFNSSPDATLLMTKVIHKPYSYTLPARRFPSKIDLLKINDGSFFKNIIDIPLQDNTPIGADACTPFPRNHEWRPDLPASLYWVEAMDEGNPKKATEFRDKLVSWASPFDNTPTEIIKFKYRFSYVGWGNDQYALSIESWNATRKYICKIINPALEKAPEILFEQSSEDVYADPGNPEGHNNKYGRYVLSISKNDELMFFGDGYSPEGKKPFIDILNLKTKKIDRIWRCDGNMLEYGVFLLNWETKQVLTRRESTNINSNYFIRNLTDITNEPQQITTFADPYPQLSNIQKKILRYKRSDGVDLTATLYLPANYEPGKGTLPTFMWAYPLEYKTKDGAGQQTHATNEFIRFSTFSPIYFVTQGFAVFDMVTIPIIGENGKEPNDTYLEQLKLGAKAAIDEGVRLGVVDSTNISIGGHSYGAFMVANLLTHTNYFKTGIACSGAYNRTLTPFGFQTEERNYWEVPSMYNSMSPFQNADKIKKPILLIHGDADNNTGTFTLQTERYYNALKGLGTPVRYVNFPYESHIYKSKESILHMYWEMDTWLKTNLKNNQNTILSGK